ncbi:MAG: hypothetical protein WC479_09220 [Candidatus Izemoplasmatales bacterium]
MYTLISTTLDKDSELSWDMPLIGLAKLHIQSNKQSIEIGIGNEKEARQLYNVAGQILNYFAPIEEVFREE